MQTLLVTWWSHNQSHDGHMIVTWWSHDGHMIIHRSYVNYWSGNWVRLEKEETKAHFFNFFGLYFILRAFCMSASGSASCIPLISFWKCCMWIRWERWIQECTVISWIIPVPIPPQFLFQSPSQSYSSPHPIPAPIPVPIPVLFQSPSHPSSYSSPHPSPIPVPFFNPLLVPVPVPKWVV